MSEIIYNQIHTQEDFTDWDISNSFFRVKNDEHAQALMSIDENGVLAEASPFACPLNTPVATPRFYEECGFYI
ncbi:hypothetical protein [Fischerella thermalis]|uniref:Uncharacterized protein n=1 Tax=Fischerella thermalis CCMEE 5318 TaxID=2019666 RepID=A0A2N6LBW9_9CYAN|nr:hypothetical protein [Fischerella thermalis]PMB20270.1 hypothetical protein CEN46_16810 [Fischerella thermalis CCMEE 5318]